MEMWQVILVFGIIAILFDAIWATIAKTKNYIYSKGVWGSFLIYIIAGIVATYNGNFSNGVISGAGVAAIEATIGWWVSWIIGPGRLPDTLSKRAALTRITSAIFMVTLTGALFGLLGAIIVSVFNWLMTIARS